MRFSPIAAATTMLPTNAPPTASLATTSPAAAPVKDSSAVPCTANAARRVITNGLISPQMIATSAPAISACWTKSSCR